MKRILYYTFSLCLWAWIVCAFASCTDEVGGSGEDGKDEFPDTEAYLSFDMLLDTEVRTNAYIPNDKIGDWENRVKEVWVMLYGEDDELAEFLLAEFFKYEVTNFDEANKELVNFHDPTDPDALSGADNMKFTTAPEYFKRGNYKMVVLANPVSTYSTVKKGDPLSDMTKVLEDVTLEQFGGNDEDDIPFFMSNANGIIDIVPSDFQTTEEDAVAKPVSVNLDRLLAKVVVKEKNGGADMPNKVTLDSKSVRWYLDVVNKKTNPIRQFAKLKGGTEDEVSTSERKLIYATDPNFTGGSASDFRKKGVDGYTPLETPWLSDVSPVTTPTYQYVFENTMDLDAQKHADWKDYTTQIVLEAHVYYQDFLATPSGPTDPGRYYYSYKTGTTSKTFSHEQVRFWLERGFPTNDMPGLEALVKANMTDRESGNTTTTFDFKAVDPDMTKVTCVTYHDITFHPDGLNMYRIPVKHFEAGAAANPRETVYGYHGVVRNNVYTVTINSLNGPGTNVVEDLGFLSVNISITPWYRRSQDEELEYD